MPKDPTAPTLHPRNPHHGRYDLKQLCRAHPPLASHLRDYPKSTGAKTIDFHDPEAVLALNHALLAQYYRVEFWQLPKGYLCPPIPGRADYIHHLADLIGEGQSQPPKGKHIHVLDIGTGASGIYPLIGCHSYAWRFTASDIDTTAVQCANTLFTSNKSTQGRAKAVLQPNAQHIFTDVIRPGEQFAATLCNPPFYASAKEASLHNQQKRRNLGQSHHRSHKTRNFAGQANELWCPGGEVAFIKKMIKESRQYAQQVRWFSTLVSKSDHLSSLKKTLKTHKDIEIRVIAMGQGHKISRILAWRFFTHSA